MNSLIPVSMFGSGLILAAAGQFSGLLQTSEKKEKFKKDLKSCNEVSL